MASSYSSLVRPPAPRETGLDLTMQAYGNVLDARSAQEARKARGIGRDIGLPGNTVEADLPGFEAERNNADTWSFLAGDRHLTGFVSDPHNAAAVKDDLPSLAQMSAIVKLAGPENSDFVNYMKRQQQQRSLLGAFDILPTRPQQRYTFQNVRVPDFKNAPDILEPINPVDPDRYLKGGFATLMLGGEQTLRAGATVLADAVGNGAPETLMKSSIYRSLSDQIEIDQKIAQAPLDDANWFKAQVYGSVQSLEYMGLALLTKKPIAAMGIQQGLQQYDTVRARGGSANEALASGVVSGAAESFFEKYFGLGWILGNFGKKATGKFIGGLLLREVPSEVATTAVQDLADAMVTGGGGWEQYKKEVGPDLLSTAAQTAIMVGMMGGPHYLAHRLAPQADAVQQIERAGAGGEFLDRLAEAAEQSKTKKEDPETLRDFIDQRTEHTPVRNIYVPVEPVVQYMQSENYKGELDRYQPQIAEAQQTKGDVVIPIGDAVAHIAGTSAWDALKEDMRIEPGGLSRNEAKQQHEEIIRTLEQRGKEIAQEAQQTNTAVTDAVQVYEEVKNRLRSSGVDERQSDAVAQIYAARYEARASRMGGTAMEQFKRSKIVFPGEAADAAGRQFGQQADTVVNIGLNVFPERGGGTVAPEEAIKALKDQGVDVTHSEVRQSGTEPTLVARLSKALTPEQGHAVSTALRQEAIAQRSGAKGDLFGPAAEKWMPFNSDYFIEPQQDRTVNQRELFQDVLPETGWTPERVSGLIDVYSREDGATSAIAVMMSPDEYLGLLANAAGRERIEERITELGYGEFDPTKMSSLPVLVVGNIGGRQQRVMGHDGRHRATMMKQAGITEMPVVVPLLDQNGKTLWTKEPMAFKDVLGNRSRSSQMENGDRLGNFRGIPISWRYKAQLAELGERVFNQSPEEIFYSAAERAVENAPQAKATAEQWKALLTPGKTPGIKSEEIEWSGIHEWLDMQKGPIEKGALLSVLQDRGIKVDEVVLGEPEPLSAEAFEREVQLLEAEDGISREYAVRAVHARVRTGFFERRGGRATQFSAYSSDQLNPTYRELLITLPIGEGSNPPRSPATHWDTESVVAHARFMEKTDAEGKRVLFIEEVQSDWHQKGRDQGYEQQTPVDPEKLATARTALQATEEALNDTISELTEKQQEATRLAGPWLIAAYENAVADIRKTAETNDKLTPEVVASVTDTLRTSMGVGFYVGRDESDQSYVGVGDLARWIASAEHSSRAPLPADLDAAMRRADRLLAELRDLKERLHLRLRELDIVLGNENKGIPEAPFKSSWPALVMKRMIRWAVDHGYERVAWTTGEEQAARYNLSQHIEVLKVQRTTNDEAGNARYVVRPFKSEGVGAISSEILDEKGVKELLGADLGGRAIEQASAADGKWAEFRGLDLHIGGEGMKAFYDRNLVNITNDIIKKYGAKVGGITIGDRKQDELQRIGNELDRLTGMSRPRDAMGRSRVWTPEEIDKWEEGNKQRLEAARTDRPEVVDIFERRIRDHKQMRELAAKWWRIARDEEAVSATHRGFEITDKMRDAASTGFSLFQGPRGRTRMTDSGQRIIELFGTADRSTLLHETGHIWLEELKDDGGADWEAVKKWFAANGTAVTKSNFIPTEAHEMWARGVERYFMEGKSPTLGLRGVFTSFKAWLMRIYSVVQNLNTPITPEIREVFDRLIATDEAIADARNANATEPLFKTAEEAGMTEAEFADYQKRVGDARDEAYDALLFKTMAKIRGERKGEMRDARSSIRDDVAREISSQPQFRLLHLLRTGRWLGEPERPEAKVKLNTGWLIDNFGEDVLDKLPRGLPITAADGETGDTIAEMVGMGSGTEVVHSLVGMRAASDELRARGETRSLRDLMTDVATDQKMAERYGDPLNDGTIEEEAIAAINTARQGEIIASEARQLAKRKSVLGVPTPYEFAREWARRTVSAGHVRDVASRAALQRYIRAANKAARAAEKAILDGDVDEAYRQKQAQLLNHALLAEAKAAADRVDKIVAKMKKLGKRAAMKSVDPDYLDKIHMLLEDYDFRERSQRSIDEQEGFQAWAERQRARGYEVHIPPRLENNGDPYTRVSVQELESLNDVIDSLLALGRKKQKLKIAQTERDFGEFRDEVVARMRRMKDRKLPAKPINEQQRRIAAMASELLKVETIAEELDGGPTGPMHDALVLGATTAENLRHQLRHDVLLPLAEMYHSLGRKYWNRLQEKVTIPELTWNSLNEGDPRTGEPVTITRSELLSILMNMGNLSNLEKLSKGERWPAATLRTVIDREMTKEDFDFAQKMWDQVEQLWPKIVETEREMAGVVPEKVVNAPLPTRFGDYRGGYWPVVYDPARWQRAEDLEGKQADDMFGLKSGVATQKGHTIARTGAYGPINLSIEKVLFSHLEQVITRIAYADYARDVIKIVRDRSIRGLMDTKLGPEYRKQIEPWLARQIHQGHPFPKGARWWDHLMRQFRINLTVAAMGFRFSTGAAQTLGLGASVQRIGGYWVGVGLKRLAASPRGAAEFAYAKSPELLHRTEAVNREVAEVANRMRQRHNWWTEAQHWALFHIGMIDRYMVSLPTWLGAYEKGRSEGMTDEEAVAYGDKSVRMSQGTGREKDMSAVQSPNSEAMRFFTMFYTPWNVMFNAQWQGARALKDTRKSFLGIKGDPRPLMAVTFWWVIAQTLGGALMSGDWPKWDFDPMAENSVEKWFARNVFFGLFAGIPVARDFANFAQRKIAGQYASDPGATPITRVGEAVKQAWDTGKRKYVKGENPKEPIKQVSDLSAILLGQPLSQPGATAQFLWDVHEGKSDPKSVSDWYFGLTKGKVPDKKAAKPESTTL